ncbi:Hpt domain-containing protein [Massilia sp. DWR3-1-1]|uniref:Hpt domain-containing protein n=1 Tax=Massilia sp. DWR3-1-1 TaxID=2804559 RepID=UPI003CE676E9
MDHAAPQPLIELFDAECRGHLEAMRAQLAALGGAGDHAAALGGLRERLHTLAGAARAVELLDVEYLCRAVEGALGDCVDGVDGGRRELAGAAIALIAQLVAAPGGRTRNQMLLLVSRCGAASGARP